MSIRLRAIGFACLALLTGACVSDVEPTEAIPGTLTVDRLPTGSGTVLPGPSQTSEAVGKVTATPSSTAGLPIPCGPQSQSELGALTVSFVANRSGYFAVYTIQADGSNLVQITQDDTNGDWPQWLPDGRRIAFIQDFNQQPRLSIIEASGSSGTVVATNIQVASSFVLSSNGHVAVFQSADEWYALDIAAGTAVKLTNAEVFTAGLPSFSPDGERMVFSANMAEGTPRRRLVVIDVDGENLRELSFPIGDAYDPDWHPSEEAILFEGIVAGEPVGLFVSDLQGDARRLPLEPEFRAPEAKWSPNGSLIAYVVRRSGFDSDGDRVALNSLHVASATGDSDLEVLDPSDGAENGLAITEFVWAPDSRHIAYKIPSRTGEFGTADLHVLDLCDGTSSLVVEGISAFASPSWRPLP